MNLTIGIDIGGSHITAASIDAVNRTIIEETFIRKHVDSAGSAEAIIEEWVNAILPMIEGFQPQDIRIGIAMPGPFNYEEGISQMKEQGKFRSLYGMNIRSLIAAGLRVPSGHISFENDAACYLAGEVFAGAGKGYKSVAGFTLGTGLGSAICKNGNTWDAGLWNSPFKESIAEDYISTRWFLNRYAALKGHDVANVKELAERYQSDETVKMIFGEFGENLASFIAAVIKKEELELVVLGGNIANSYHLFSEKLSAIEVPVKLSVLGENAALIGAASSIILSDN